MRRHLGLVGSLLLVVSACGGPASSETSAVSTTSLPTTTTTLTTTTTVDLFAAAPVVDVCSLMTVEEAEAILGSSLNRDPALVSDEYGDECDWNATVPRGTGSGPQTLWIRVVQSGRGGAGDGFSSAEDRFRDRVETNGAPDSVVDVMGYAGLMDDLAGLIVILDADLIIQLRANTTDLMDTNEARATQAAMANMAVPRLAGMHPGVQQPTTSGTESQYGRWDEECESVLTDVLEIVEAEAAEWEDLPIADVVAGVDLSPDLAERAETASARFETLGCSSFFWDIRLLEEIDAVPASTGSGFVAKARAAELPVFHVTWEYLDAVDEFATPNPDPPEVPELDPAPDVSTCEAAFEFELTVMQTYVAAAEHLTSLTTTPDPSVVDWDSIAEAYAAVSPDVEELDCDDLDRAAFFLEHHAELPVTSFYAAVVKYGFYEGIVDEFWKATWPTP